MRTAMRLQVWTLFANRHRRTLGLVALITTFGGVALGIDRPKGTVLEWLAPPLLALGGALFAWAAWPPAATAAAPKSAATKVLDRITLHGRLVPLFPAIGVGIVLADIGYNVLLSATPAIKTEDTIVLLGAATLLAYRLVPARFARERDFVFLFFACLNGILVLPLLIARAYYADFDRSVDLYSWVALAPETSAVLKLLGVGNNVHAVTGSTAPGLTFNPLRLSVPVTVVITTACSGIYSFGIFASALVAFVLTECATLTKRMWLVLGLGLGAAYLANVLRMVVIVVVGYYTDSGQTDLQNMLIAHSYAGWIIFLSWIALFWAAVFRLLPIDPGGRGSSARPAVPLRSSNRCGICLGALTPTLPAARCACGMLYHQFCKPDTERCPSCGRGMETPERPHRPRSDA